MQYLIHREREPITGLGSTKWNDFTKILGNATKKSGGETHSVSLEVRRLLETALLASIDTKRTVEIVHREREQQQQQRDSFNNEAGISARPCARSTALGTNWYATSFESRDSVRLSNAAVIPGKVFRDIQAGLRGSWRRTLSAGCFDDYHIAQYEPDFSDTRL
jgi:hypothetical protein